jgi:putative oxidoreductase
MRNVALLGTRLVLGGYLAAHGAQKLFGSFDGPGIDATSAGFDQMGLTPGKQMATLASVSELGGGILTAAGAVWPIGPVAILGAMTVASTVHRKAGPFTAAGGYELPLTNAAPALLLATSGPGTLRIPLHLPKLHTRGAVAVGIALTAYSLAKLLQAQPAPEAAAEVASDLSASEVTAADLLAAEVTATQGASAAD